MIKFLSSGHINTKAVDQRTVWIGRVVTCMDFERAWREHNNNEKVQGQGVDIPKIAAHETRAESNPISFQGRRSIRKWWRASFLFQLMEMVEKIEVLAQKVEELGELAGFETK